MNQQLKENKQIIREFLRTNYSDERLAMLLAHAQSGKLAYFSCCCFVGIPTADHALQGLVRHGYEQPHYLEAKKLPDAEKIEFAYCCLGDDDDGVESDPQRRRRLIPIIKAEIRRRDKQAKESAEGSNNLNLELVGSNASISKT